MSWIRTHGVTVRGGDAARQIVLRPLADEHLPWLYKWNADPEVLYYTEGGTAEEELSYPPEVVRQIYGGVSHNAFCFLVECTGAVIC